MIKTTIQSKILNSTIVQATPLSKEATNNNNNNNINNNNNNNKNYNTKMNDSDSAWALLALRSAPGSPSRITWQGRQSPDEAIARLEGKGFEYMVRRDKIVIGRRTSRERIDVNMGHSAFISRHHLEIYHQASHFYMKCISKNGIFVDGLFYRNDSEPVKLQKSCTFRFPSTGIKLAFQSLINEEPIDLKMAQVGNFKPPAQSPQPVKDTCDFRSQPQSPADTISAANSCPTSPRPSTKWHTSSRTQPNSPQSQAHHNNNINNNNNNNNNNGNNINNNNNNNNINSAAGYVEVFDQNFMDASEVILDTDGNSTVAPGVVDNSHPSYHHNPPHQLMYSTVQQSNVGSEMKPVFHHEPSTSNISMGSGGSGGRHHDDGKPPFSYAQLIVQAISAASDKQLTLNGIYSYITRNYPYYKTADKGWQNSIRHNLSLNRYFVKVPRNQEEPGKGSFWRIETSNENKLLDQAYRRRRKRENSNNSAALVANTTATTPDSSRDQGLGIGDTELNVKKEETQNLMDISQPIEGVNDNIILELKPLIAKNLADVPQQQQPQQQQLQIQTSQPQELQTHEEQQERQNQQQQQPPQRLGGDEVKPQDITTVASCVSSIVSSVVSQGGNGDQ